MVLVEPDAIAVDLRNERGQPLWQHRHGDDHRSGIGGREGDPMRRGIHGALPCRHAGRRGLEFQHPVPTTGSPALQIATLTCRTASRSARPSRPTPTANTATPEPLPSSARAVPVAMAAGSSPARYFASPAVTTVAGRAQAIASSPMVR